MNLLDYFLILMRNRWRIFKQVFVFTLLALIISLIVPKWYKATATVLPVGGSGGGISSLLSGYSLDIFGKNVVIPETYRVILTSQGLRDSLISRFNLFEVYDKDYREHVYEAIENNVEVEIDKEIGLGYAPVIAINVHVLDEEPQRAADMANFCIDFLDRRTVEINGGYVNSKFRFVEDRYFRGIEELELAEQKLQEFQDLKGILEIREQMRAMVQTFAALEAEKEKLEIELAVAGATIHRSSPQYQRLKTHIDILKRRITKLKDGKAYAANESLIFYPPTELPELARNYFDLYREVEIKAKILEMLTIQFEQIRFQVGKEIPTLMTLDHAQVPTYKARPKRILIVLAAFLLSFIVSVVVVFVKHFYQTSRDEDQEQFRKMDEILAMLNSDWKRLRRK